MRGGCRRIPWRQKSHRIARHRHLHSISRGLHHQFLVDRFGKNANEFHKIRGLVHPCLMWQEDDSSVNAVDELTHNTFRSQTPLVSIRIGPDSPKHEEDLLMLFLTRALADSVITSSKNIRSEPGLTVSLTADAMKWNLNLQRWRATFRYQIHPDPVVVVITRGYREINFKQDFFEEWHRNPSTTLFRPIVVVAQGRSNNVADQYRRQTGIEPVFSNTHDSPSERYRKKLRGHCLDRKTLEIVESSELDDPLSGPVDGFNVARSFLNSFDYRTTSIEAGLSTCGHLYTGCEGGQEVDYLFLSRYGGIPPAEHTMGKQFVSPLYIKRHFTKCGGYHWKGDHSAWCFDVLKSCK